MIFLRMVCMTRINAHRFSPICTYLSDSGEIYHAGVVDNIALSLRFNHARGACGLRATGACATISRSKRALEARARSARASHRGCVARVREEFVRTPRGARARSARANYRGLWRRARSTDSVLGLGACARNAYPDHLSDNRIFLNIGAMHLFVDQYRLSSADWFPISTVQYRIWIRCEDWKFSFRRVRKYETQMSKYLFFVYLSFGFI